MRTKVEGNEPPLGSSTEHLHRWRWVTTSSQHDTCWGPNRGQQTRSSHLLASWQLGRTRPFETYVILLAHLESHQGDSTFRKNAFGLVKVWPVNRETDRQTDRLESSNTADTTINVHHCFEGLVQLLEIRSASLA
jgi:hypothetical protein